MNWQIIALILGILLLTVSVRELLVEIKRKYGVPILKGEFRLPNIFSRRSIMIAHQRGNSNLEAAQQSIKHLLGQITGSSEKLKKVNVTDVMVTPARMLTVPDQEKLEAIKVTDLLLSMNESGLGRIAILKYPELTFLAVVQRSTLDKVIYDFTMRAMNSSDLPIDMNELTIGHLLRSTSDLYKHILTTSFENNFFPVTAKLSDILLSDWDNIRSQDIFITLTGKMYEKVEGWISADMVSKMAELANKVDKG